MTTISPSLLAADFLNLKTELDQFSGLDNLWLHLDIMDGHFVPNLSFGAPVLKKISSISDHKLDAHLMVTNPEDFIKPLSDIGIHNFTFHWEALTHHDRFIHLLKESFPSVGVALNPSTNIDIIPTHLLQEIDLILIMSVNPGFGGQSFIEGSIDKIKALAKLKLEGHYKFDIQVDGGVNDQNAKRLIDAGVNNLVAGSYIFKSNNYKTQVEKLRN
jgi:ribulose-phosphate 3-epimerase